MTTPTPDALDAAHAVGFRQGVAHAQATIERLSAALERAAENFARLQVPHIVGHDVHNFAYQAEQAVLAADALFANVGGKLVDVRVYPIPIRTDCTVRIFGIPHDLTRAEAEKIGRVVMALFGNMGKGE